MSITIKDKPDSHIATFAQSIVDGGRPVQLNFDEASKTNIESTSSFRYSQQNFGLKSTQQVRTDFSKFENHTFFNSAEANVNVAFETIINNFPFDGTKREYEHFFDKLSGFEKWAYDQFPKNKGYLLFSGSFIKVNDTVGSEFPTISKLNTGDSILDPEDKSFSLEMHLYAASGSNVHQVVCQRLSGSYGFTLLLSGTNNLSQTNLIFGVASGSQHLYVSASVNKDVFNHVCAVFDRELSSNKLQLYVNERLLNETTSSFNFNNFRVKNTPLYIGSGSAVTYNGVTYTPTLTLSGAIDEFRYFHSARTLTEQKLYAKKAIYADTDLKLYFKFNEPTGTIGSSASDSINRIVLDSSGHSLHSMVDATGWTHVLRSTGSITCPMVYEKMDLSPVLFPAFSNIISLNTRLLTSASAYDKENPNLITKLIPSHYFLNGQLFEGLLDESGTMGNLYGGSSIPGSGEMGSAQLLSSFLFVWAKFFDEMKIFTDAFSKIKTVDYDSHETTPDSFLTALAKWYGFNLPTFFNDASLAQFVDAENIQDNISTNTYSLSYIQNQILRRILSNLREFITSKGTLHSIKSFLRAFGINPDNSFKIREFGGPTTRPLEYSREIKLEPGTMLSMSLGSIMKSGYLSGSRLEVGFPAISSGSLYVQKNIFSPHGISDSPKDGLYTSGSFTYEAIYKYPTTKSVLYTTQSLAQLCVTGTSNTNNLLYTNLIAVSASAPSDVARITLYTRPGTVVSSPIMSMSLDVDIFDGNKWNISFGRQRNDHSSILNTVSSSWFLRAGKITDSEPRYNATASYFQESWSVSDNILQNLVTGFNASGSYISIGSRSIDSGTATGSYFMLHNTTTAPAESRWVLNESYISNIRFWSKALELNEWIEHIRNYKSLGVSDPKLNFNFNIYESGSFEKLRLDVNTNQTFKTTDSGGYLQLFDYSQNNLHFSGTNFPASTKIILPELFYYSFISPAFDEAISSDKIRVRSYQNMDLVDATPWAGVAPVYRIEPSEKPIDDVRLSIEFSVIDALNRDIISIFSTLDSLNNIIGEPELLFSPDYPGLENLRNIYFNRLTDKINIKAFFEFFRWFDTSVGIFIEQLIPRKTKFYGVNYVIESHMLERPKLEYYHNKMWLDRSERAMPYNELPIELISGDLKRY